MLSIQEILDKTVAQRKAIGDALDASNSQKGWHPEDANLYDGLKPADHYEVKQTMDSLTLAEVLMKGRTSDGSDKLVAAKLHDTLFYAAKEYDICHLLGYMVGPWAGANLTVNIGMDGTYKPHHFASGGKIAEEEVSFLQATATMEGYGITIMCGEDLDEDTRDYGLVQWHVEQAGKACGKKATDLALAVMIAPPDGDGTYNTKTTATTDRTILAEVLEAISLVGDDRFNANTMVATTEAWRDTLGTALVGVYRDPAPGYLMNFATLDSLLWPCSPILHDPADADGAVMTTCKTLVFDRNNSMLTARKRWLEVKNYADPIEDIAGAVVSFRQDSVTLYKDAICVITEST